ncbi:MAG TPA: hypothetical protein VJ793_11180 [Anaerolineae bacterium]|nr:hypothetical protein [Anaerolineae bacterium]
MPDSTLVLRVAVALLPTVTRGCSQLLRRRPRLGWALALLPLVGLGLLAWLAPDYFQSLALDFLDWLAAQGVPIPVEGRLMVKYSDTSMPRAAA